jgi:hypothetical protein
VKRIVAIIALIVSALAIPASADSQVETLTFMLVRTTSGPSHFDLLLSASSPSSGGYIGDIDGVVRHGRVVRVDSGSMNDLRFEEDGVDVATQHVRTCGLAHCRTAPDGALLTEIGYAAKHSRGDVNALFFVLHGVRLDYHLDAVGWRIVPMRLNYRLVNTWDASPARVSSGVYSAAVVDGATAPGGRSGSLAVATPPCSISASGIVSRGAGQIQLTGGVTAPTFTCPTDRIPIGSYTNRKTTWSVDGWAAGDSTQSDTTLFVIDRPARLPYAAP